MFVSKAAQHRQLVQLSWTHYLRRHGINMITVINETQHKHTCTRKEAKSEYTLCEQKKYGMNSLT